MSDSPQHTDPEWTRRLRRRVLRWYDRNGRKLPWRESADPYRIWLSEIMLQQTTVAAVMPYFERFIEQFPNVQRLAAAGQDQVLRLWEGLGYYSRARNLHKAANILVHEFACEFPQTPAELQRLPGIGPYTAGAIASFAFGQPAGILEANTLRLYARLMELETDPRGTREQKELWKFASRIVSRGRPADFNQAVMDIGSQVCRPVAPDCPACPLRSSCRTFASGRQNEIPLQSRKPEITDVVEISIAIRKGDRFLLRQRPDGERWGGLWDFVRFEVSEEQAAQFRMPPQSRRGRDVLKEQRTLFAETAARQPFLFSASLQERVEQMTGTSVLSYEPCVEIRHAVTRYRIRLLCLESQSEGGRITRGSGYQWCSRKQLLELPLSTTGRQFANLLAST